MTQLGAKTSIAGNPDKAQNLLQMNDSDFVLPDVKLPCENSQDLLNLKFLPSNCDVVVITAEGGARSDVKGMKKGANEYLVKLFDF